MNESTPLPTRPTCPITRSQTYKQVPIGTIVRRKFKNGKWYEGEVTHYNQTNKFYMIKYCDGDTEDYSHSEMKEYRKPKQHYRKTGPSKCYLLKKFDKRYSSSQQKLLQTLSNEIISDKEHRFSSSISLTNSRQNVMNSHLQQADAYGMMN